MKSAHLVPLLLALGCGATSPRAESAGTAPARRPCTVALRFEEPPGEAPGSNGERGAALDDAPRTDVALVVLCEGEATRRVALGREVGACYRTDPADALLRATCWWGGQGAWLEVRRQGTDLVVLRADVDEVVGRGQARERARLTVPADAFVRPL